MVKRLCTLCMIGNIIALTGSSMQESILGSAKPAVNFYGKIATHQGNDYSVENLTINGMYKQIPVYEVPKITSEKRILDLAQGYDKAELDLAEISEISVPDQQAVWTVIETRNKRSSEKKFIEVLVTYNDKSSKKYLIPEKSKVGCDQVMKEGPIDIEKQLSIKAIKSLKIDGYKYPDVGKRQKQVQNKVK